MDFKILLQLTSKSYPVVHSFRCYNYTGQYQNLTSFTIKSDSKKDNLINDVTSGKGLYTTVICRHCSHISFVGDDARMDPLFGHISQSTLLYLLCS